LMKAYAGEMQKLECRFQSLKLEHVPHGQDAAVKELSWIAAKDCLFHLELTWKSCLSRQPSQRKRILGSSQHQSKEFYQSRSCKQSRQTWQASGALCPLRLAGLTEW
jgi:hypothetical protein